MAAPSCCIRSTRRSRWSRAPIAFAASASSSPRMRFLSLIELARLSSEQREALAGYGERWLGLRTCTEPADRPAAEAGVHEAYAAAGLPPPERVVWTAGPRELAQAWSSGEAVAGDNVRSRVVDIVCRRAEVGVDRAIGLAAR